MLTRSLFHSYFARAGSGDKYLMTTWEAINNNGVFYSSIDRPVSKSSSNSASCKLPMHDDCCKAIVDELSTDATKWWNAKNDPTHPLIYMYVLSLLLLYFDK